MSLQQIYKRLYHRSMKYKIIDLSYTKSEEEFLLCTIFDSAYKAMNYFSTKWTEKD